MQLIPPPLAQLLNSGSKDETSRFRIQTAEQIEQTVCMCICMCLYVCMLYMTVGARVCYCFTICRIFMPLYYSEVAS